MECQSRRFKLAAHKLDIAVLKQSTLLNCLVDYTVCKKKLHQSNYNLQTKSELFLMKLWLYPDINIYVFINAVFYRLKLEN